MLSLKVVVSLVLFAGQLGTIWCGFACLRHTCLNGICIDGLNSTRNHRDCFCIDGFTGYSCQINWDECNVDPCKNGGTCIDGIASFNCSCPDNFAGVYCEYDLSECSTFMPCEHNGTCRFDPGLIIPGQNGSGFYCACHPGFRGDLCQEDISVCNSTQNVCLNGGRCEDGLGDKFTCACTPGWVGKFCETNWDECSSAPCQNGGICIDGLNDFECACQFSYTGKQCELKLEFCPVNPCQNGGLCLVEDATPTCYCVPDFHGKLCEERYNECEPAPKCFNGGTCIDGVGGFNCSCPPDVWGPQCQCTAENATDPACSAPPSTTMSPGTNESITETPPPFWSSTVTTKVYPTPSPTPADQTHGYSPTPTATESGDIEPTATESEGPEVTPSVTATSSDQSEEATPTPSLDLSTSLDFSTTVTVVMPSETASWDEIHPTPSPTLSDEFMSDEYDMRSTSTFSNFDTATFSPTPSVERPSPSPTVTGPWDDVTPPLETEATTTEEIPSTTPEEDVTPTSPMSPGDNVTTPDSGVATTEGTTQPTTTQPATANTSEEGEGRSDGHTGSDSSMSPTTSVTEGGERSTVVTESSTAGNRTDETTTTRGDADLSSTTPSDADLSSTTPKDADLSSTTPKDADISSITPKDADFGSTTPKDADFSSITPKDADFSSTTPKDADFSSTTPKDADFSPTTPKDADFSSTTTKDADFSSTTPKDADFGSTTPKDADFSSTTPKDADFGSTTPKDADFGSTTPRDADLGSTTPESSSGQTGGDIATGRTTGTPTMGSGSSESPTVTPRGEPTTSSRSSLESEPPTAAVTSTVPHTNDSWDDPCFNYCQNAAKCIPSSLEPICICHFKFTGRRCEIVSEKVAVPAFRGNSFLRYKVSRHKPRHLVDISLRMATVVPDGLVLYTSPPPESITAATGEEVALGSAYALVFIQNGHLVLHFSCGSQSMEFVETRTRVNNGFNFTLELTLALAPQRNRTDLHCLGKLNVNGSDFVMSGEQLVGNTSLTSFETILVGGVGSAPVRSEVDDVVAFVPGFRGCLFSVMINKEERNMYEEAEDGNEISECETFACVTNPCYGSSKCIPSLRPPFWECICPTGYIGRRCQIKLCLENPCKNGATCNHGRFLGNGSRSGAVAITNATVTCLCPLGFTGATCESRINITKPSFHPTEDYAAYISYYGLPYLYDWFQMKFHFVTTNFTQIALLAYMGNGKGGQGSEPQSLIAGNQLESPVPSQSSSELSSTNNLDPFTATVIPDFFSVSFLQGYLGLTWNLGSGTQRIVTPAKVDPRLQIHTITFGRAGRQAWIKVDGMRNITGKTPGPMYRLNVDEELYIGGHRTYRFEGLPHDLPLHTGFQGCIFDLGLRAKNRLMLPKPFKGRNVKNCFEDC